MGTASPNNVIISKDNAQVTIATTKVEQIWNKTLILIPKPKSDAQKDSAESENKPRSIDLLMKAERRWGVDGYISSEIGATDTNFSSGSTLYANEKRDVFAAIFFYGKTFTLNIEGTDHTVNADKVSIIWEASDEDTAIDKYTVKFTVVECTE